MLLQIGAMDPAMQSCGQCGDDVIERLGHRGERVVGAKDDVVVAEDLNGGQQRLAAVGQRVAPQPAGQPTGQLG
jgi:hypothetical protein